MDSADDDAPRLGLWHRLLVALPRVGQQGEKPPLGERLRRAALKPAEPDHAPKAPGSVEHLSVEELEHRIKYADDKERLVGLLAAPFAAIIGLIIHSDLIARDHVVRLKGGRLGYQTNPAYYHDMLLVLLVLSVLMVATAWFRKRLFLGVVLVLYGITVFNLRHYFGFAIPYVLAAAWLLVRSFRLQQQLREATTGASGGQRVNRGGGRRTSAPPGSSKRYTPPTNQPRQASERKPDGKDGKKRAG